MQMWLSVLLRLWAGVECRPRLSQRISITCWTLCGFDLLRWCMRAYCILVESTSEAFPFNSGSSACATDHNSPVAGFHISLSLRNPLWHILRKLFYLLWWLELRMASSTVHYILPPHYHICFAQNFLCQLRGNLNTRHLHKLPIDCRYVCFDMDCLIFE